MEYNGMTPGIAIRYLLRQQGDQPFCLAPLARTNISADFSASATSPQKSGRRGVWTVGISDGKNYRAQSPTRIIPKRCIPE